MKRKVVVTAAICGNKYTKKDNPAVPYTIAEIREEAKRAYNAGAAVIHLHVREDDGTHTLRAGRFEEAMQAIYDVCPEVIIVPTTGCESFKAAEEQLRIIDLAPEMASMNCELRGSSSGRERCEETLRSLGNTMLDNGVKPILECCDMGMVDTMMRLYQEGWLTDPVLFNFTLGEKGGMNATVENLLYLAKSLPSRSVWSVTGIEEGLFDAVAMGVLLDGHVRVGFENGLYLDEGVLARSNGDMVEKAVSIIRALGCEPTTPAEARALLGLNLQHRIPLIRSEEDRLTMADSEAV